MKLHLHAPDTLEDLEKVAGAVADVTTPTNESVKASIIDGSPPTGGGPDVVLPCEDCVHAAVCSIKPLLEVFAQRIDLPLLPHSAISVAAIGISCTHYLAGAE